MPRNMGGQLPIPGASCASFDRHAPVPDSRDRAAAAGAEARWSPTAALPKPPTKSATGLLQKNVDDAALRLNAAVANDLAMLSAAASQIALGEDPAQDLPQPARAAWRPEQTRFSALLYAANSGPPACQIGACSARHCAKPAPSAAICRSDAFDRRPMAPFSQRVAVSPMARAVAFYSAASLFTLADPVDDVPLSQFELRSACRHAAAHADPDELAARG